jgi:selenocysteine lyase/cysteine desulfurase
VAEAAGAYLHTKPEQVAFTDSTTMGLGLLYTGLRLGTGGEILTTEHDFYATHESLRLRGLRDGVPVKTVRLYDDPATASVDQIVSRLSAALTPRTRIVAVTWVHSGTGVKLPIRAIADAIRAGSAGNGEAPLLCVDGVHGFGAEAVTPDELGADFLVSGCHKWLFGPRGTGLIWGRPSAWARFTPVIPTFGGGDGPGVEATPGGYHSFEHRWALAEAFGFATAIGPDRIARRTRELATRLKDGLAGIGGVVLRTPRTPDLSAGVVCCEVTGLSPPEAVTRLLAAKVVASATPYATSYLRFGTSILTDERDVETALRAVRALR